MFGGSIVKSVTCAGNWSPMISWVCDTFTIRKVAKLLSEHCPARRDALDVLANFPRTAAKKRLAIDEYEKIKPTNRSYVAKNTDLLFQSVPEFGGFFDARGSIAVVDGYFQRSAVIKLEFTARVAEPLHAIERFLERQGGFASVG